MTSKLTEQHFYGAEVTFALLTQLPQVLFSALPKIYFKWKFFYDIAEI